MQDLIQNRWAGVGMLRQLIGNVEDNDRRKIVTSVVIGVAFIAVEVEHSQVGLCANIAYTDKGGCNVFEMAGRLAGSSVEEIFGLATEYGYVSRSIALAAVNAIGDACLGSIDGDILDVLDLSGTRVAVIGLIEPVVEALERKGCEISVFDKRNMTHPLIRPVEEMKKYVSDATFVIITATTIINDTLTEILHLSRNAKDVILMGPTTPMHGQVFKAAGVTWLAGSKVLDGRKAMQIVMEGGGTRALYRLGAVKKVIQRVA